MVFLPRELSSLGLHYIRNTRITIYHNDFPETWDFAILWLVSGDGVIR